MSFSQSENSLVDLNEYQYFICFTPSRAVREMKIMNTHITLQKTVGQTVAFMTCMTRIGRTTRTGIGTIGTVGRGICRG